MRLAFLLSELNGIDLVTVDITNAYVNALCREKVVAVAGPEFGEYEGCVVIIEKAQRGMRTSLRS